MLCRYCRKPLERVDRDPDASTDIRAMFSLLPASVHTVYVRQDTRQRVCTASIETGAHEPMVLITMEVWPQQPSALSCDWCAEPMVWHIAGHYHSCDAHALWAVRDISDTRLWAHREATAP